ncbi:MAG: winged helix-turn-helix transcriptional regulator [Acidimicrobiaceae bacterium]|nr:winged helix-turn-helix transcriptional regulator [Acidimicrobiaceae bacterium]MBO0746768.1 winged helix-turn-helix transcriptional regulator [Acidimicrobiaceae bacterium]
MDAHTVEPEPGQFALASETFKLLADPTRLRILWELLQEEHSVGDLARCVGAQPAAVSQHLARLRAAHLVRSRRQGNRMFYGADDAHVRHLVEETLRHGAHLVNRDVARGSPGEDPVLTVA